MVLYLLQSLIQGVQLELGLMTLAGMIILNILRTKNYHICGQRQIAHKILRYHQLLQQLIKSRLQIKQLLVMHLLI